MYWIVEILLSSGAWFELAEVERPDAVGLLLRALCEVGGRPASTVRVTGVDLPFAAKPVAKLPE